MKIQLKLVAALLCGGLAWSPANAAPQPVATDPGTAYVGPHQRVDIGGGRKLNLFCMGSGGPTVLFDSGLSDWSSIWALVQPAVAKRMQACSYDRAGMGYSDPSETPRTFPPRYAREYPPSIANTCTNCARSPSATPESHSRSTSAANTRERTAGTQNTRTLPRLAGNPPY